jgi:hypothetical protein
MSFTLLYNLSRHLVGGTAPTGTSNKQNIKVMRPFENGYTIKRHTQRLIICLAMLKAGLGITVLLYLSNNIL